MINNKIDDVSIATEINASCRNNGKTFNLLSYIDNGYGYHEEWDDFDIQFSLKELIDEELASYAFQSRRLSNKKDDQVYFIPESELNIIKGIHKQLKDALKHIERTIKESE